MSGEYFLEKSMSKNYLGEAVGGESNSIISCLLDCLAISKAVLPIKFVIFKSAPLLIKNFTMSLFLDLTA